MTVNTRTTWVVPPLTNSGQDHLSVRTACETIYSQLLPGITNVTERGRCYSFYPWLIWSFETRYDDHSRASLERVIRRAECLLTLIGLRHSASRGGTVDEDSDEGLHAGGLVGRRTLLHVDLDDPEGIDLSAYATKEVSPTRYFKNPLGALGQYYFGPLRDLRIVDYVEVADIINNKPIGYDKERGKMLAEAFSQKAAEDRFFQVLEAERVFA